MIPILFVSIKGVAVAATAVVTTVAAAAVIYADYKNGLSAKTPETPNEEGEDDDRVINHVEVHLFTENVDLCSCGSTISNNSSNVSISNVSGLTDKMFRHWRLVFEFPYLYLRVTEFEGRQIMQSDHKKKFIIYEANEKDSRLVWTCEKNNKAPTLKEGNTIHYLGTCSTSPKRLQKIAREIKINNLPYNMCLRNCQEWIKLFAKEIGGEVYSSIKIRHSLYEEHPIASFIIGSGWAAMHTGKNITKKIFTKENEHHD